MKYNEKLKSLKLTGNEMHDCYRHISRAIYPVLEAFSKEHETEHYQLIAWSFKQLATNEGSPKSIKKDLVHGVISKKTAKEKLCFYMLPEEAEHLVDNPEDISGDIEIFATQVYDKAINLGLKYFALEFRDMCD